MNSNLDLHGSDSVAGSGRDETVWLRAPGYAARLGMTLGAFYTLRSRHPESIARPVTLPGIRGRWLLKDIEDFEHRLRAPQAPVVRRGRKNTQERFASGGAQ